MISYQTKRSCICMLCALNMIVSQYISCIWSLLCSCSFLCLFDLKAKQKETQADPVTRIAGLWFVPYLPYIFSSCFGGDRFVLPTLTLPQTFPFIALALQPLFPQAFPSKGAHTCITKLQICASSPCCLDLMPNSGRSSLILETIRLYLQTEKDNSTQNRTEGLLASSFSVDLRSLTDLILGEVCLTTVARGDAAPNTMPLRRLRGDTPFGISLSHRLNTIQKKERNCWPFSRQNHHLVSDQSGISLVSGNRSHGVMSRRLILTAWIPML